MDSNTREISRLENLSYHESGHGIAASIFHYPISEIEVFVDECDNYGYIIIDFHPNGRSIRQCLEEKALVSCAGSVATYLRTGRKHWSRSSEDYIDATNALSWIYPHTDEATAYLALLWLRAKNLLEEPANWYLVEYLAADIEATQEEPEYQEKDQFIADYDCEHVHHLDGGDVQYRITKAIARYKQLSRWSWVGQR